MMFLFKAQQHAIPDNMRQCGPEGIFNSTVLTIFITLLFHLLKIPTCFESALPLDSLGEELTSSCENIYC